MRKALLAIGLLAAVFGLGGTARGEMVVEWWGQGGEGFRCRHTGMTIELSKYGQEGRSGLKDTQSVHALTFDPSPIKKGATIYHASLRIHTRPERIRTDKRAYMSIGKGVWYYDPLRLYAELPARRPVENYVAQAGSAAGKAVYDKSAPLVLEGPQFKSFDCTAAVRDWASGKAPNLGFVVRQLDGWEWRREMTVLEVRYEGKVD